MNPHDFFGALIASKLEPMSSNMRDSLAKLESVQKVFKLINFPTGGSYPSRGFNLVDLLNR